MMQSSIAGMNMFAVSQEMHRVWGRFDHQNPGDGTGQMLLVLGGAVVAGLILLIWFRASRRPQRRFVANSPWRLFRELCRAHGLGYSSRRLMKRLAVARGLTTPALLFVEPKHFDLEDLPDSLQPSAESVQRLRTQLFGQLG